MTDLPILFSAPMVRGLLDGRKTQTRRVLKGQPGDLDKPFIMDDGSWHVTDSRGGHMSPLAVRFRKGDRLYVREAWAEVGSMDPGLFITRADYPACVPRHYENVPPADEVKWRPGIHMPRARSRLTLTVTDVRVQRLQACSEADALEEGIEQHGRFFGLPDGDWDDAELTAVAAYRRVWTQINGADSWDANPWIVALTFTVERRNIDAARAA